MASKLSHYIWLFDTILHNKRISQKEIEKKWEMSPFYDGKKLSRSTFVRWKEKAEEKWAEIGSRADTCDPDILEKLGY